MKKILVVNSFYQNELQTRHPNKLKLFLQQKRDLLVWVSLTFDCYPPPPLQNIFSLGSLRNLQLAGILSIVGELPKMKSFIRHFKTVNSGKVSVTELITEEIYL